MVDLRNAPRVHVAGKNTIKIVKMNTYFRKNGTYFDYMNEKDVEIEPFCQCLFQLCLSMDEVFLKTDRFLCFLPQNPKLRDP